MNPADIRSIPQVVTFQQAASRFCDSLELDAPKPELWIREVLVALSDLFAAANRLAMLEPVEFSEDIPEEFRIDHDQWKATYDRVSRALPQTSYLTFFDLTEALDLEQKPAIGDDLADDLADIYHDLKPGLRAFADQDDAVMGAVLFEWQFSFQSHWGDHAVNALKLLKQLVHS
jgi:Domain of unknown function (DUF5063)